MRSHMKKNDDEKANHVVVKPLTPVIKILKYQIL